MTRTNAYTLLCVVIRAFALWLVVSLVLMLPGQIVGMRGAAAGGEWSPWLVFVPVLAGLLIAAVLWLFAGKLARLALAKPEDELFQSDLDASTWFGILLAGIGAWYFFDGLLDGAYLIGKAVFAARQRALHPGMEIPDGLLLDGIVTALQVLLGAALVLRGRGLVALLRRLRYAGYGQGRSGD